MLFGFLRNAVKKSFNHPLLDNAERNQVLTQVAAMSRLARQSGSHICFCDYFRPD